MPVRYQYSENCFITHCFHGLIYFPPMWIHWNGLWYDTGGRGKREIISFLEIVKKKKEKRSESSVRLRIKFMCNLQTRAVGLFTCCHSDWMGVRVDGHGAPKHKHVSVFLIETIEAVLYKVKRYLYFFFLCHGFQPLPPQWRWVCFGLQKSDSFSDVRWQMYFCVNSVKWVGREGKEMVKCISCLWCALWFGRCKKLEMLALMHSNTLDSCLELHTSENNAWLHKLWLFPPLRPENRLRTRLLFEMLIHTVFFFMETEWFLVHGACKASFTWQQLVRPNVIRHMCLTKGERLFSHPRHNVPWATQGKEMIIWWL